MPATMLQAVRGLMMSERTDPRRRHGCDAGTISKDRTDLDQAAFRNGIVNAIPNLRAFAYSLCGDQDRADDLVQEALLKAWAKQDTFEPGTNLKAWLFTILRNNHFSAFRKKRKEVEDPNDALAAQLYVNPGQQEKIDFKDMLSAIAALPDDQREALLLVAAEGFAYEEAALICDCAVGTVKSRVNRARNRLAQLMHLDADDVFGSGRKLA